MIVYQAQYFIIFQRVVVLVFQFHSGLSRCFLPLCLGNVWVNFRLSDSCYRDLIDA
jgi:hypothetical protein